jgi:hypothetical protein
MYGTAIAYTITTATCLRYGTVPYVRTPIVSGPPLSPFDLLAMLHGNGDTRYYCRRAIVRANCYHSQGHSAPCGAGGDHLYMLLFGAAQAVLSLIPNFHSMAWLSAVAAVMSFTYATIGLGLGLAKTIGDFALVDRARFSQRCY